MRGASANQMRPLGTFNFFSFFFFFFVKKCKKNYCHATEIPARASCAAHASAASGVNRYPRV